LDIYVIFIKSSSQKANENNHLKKSFFWIKTAVQPNTDLGILTGQNN